MSNNVTSYNRTISNRDGVVPGRENVRCGRIQPSSSDHIKYVKYVNYVYANGTKVQCMVERAKLLKHKTIDVVIYAVFKNHVGTFAQLG